MPGVGGPSYEQPFPTTAPLSIKMAYDPLMLNAALGILKYSTVPFEPISTSWESVSTLYIVCPLGNRTSLMYEEVRGFFIYIKQCKKIYQY